jgi:hypothetical protein
LANLAIINSNDLIMLGLTQPKVEIEKKPFLIYPDTFFSGLWQFLISLVLLISVFITPFNLAFENYSTYPSYA